MADPSRSAAVEAEPIEQLQQKMVARIYTFLGEWLDGGALLGRAYKGIAFRLWSGGRLLERFP